MYKRQARVRSTRRDGSAPRADRAASSRSALSVYDGGRQGRSEASPTRREPRGTAGGYGRIDLGSDAGYRGAVITLGSEFSRFVVGEDGCTCLLYTSRCV